MRAQVLLGMLSGALVALGLSLIMWFFLFQVFSHHMFIIGIQSPVGVIFCSIPVLLVTTGAVIGVRALRR
jgi:hypothetical protein